MTLQNIEMNNPLLDEFHTLHGVPPFGQIKDEHYLPAINDAILSHKREIDAIADNNELPNFINTIEALDKAGEALSRVTSVFFNMTSANTNEGLEKISEEIAPELAKHFDYIILNEKLFSRVKNVWESKENFELNEEQNELLEKTYKSFVRNGALLSIGDKSTITFINAELSVLSIKFGQNTLAEVNEYNLIVDDIEDLKGLSDDLLMAASERAKAQNLNDVWAFSLQNPSVIPFLQYAENRSLRERIWRVMQNKGNNGDKNDNNEIVKKIVNLRLQRANLLGYQTHAHYVLEEQMAKNPNNVNQLLNQLWTPALNMAKMEAKEIQAFIDNEGGDFILAPHDWRFYSEKIRKQKFDLDENEIKQYFSLENVRQGVFFTVSKLFGLSFQENFELPSYHPEAVPYEVFDADGRIIGILYMDFHPRDSKRGGAWMTSFCDQKKKNGERILPVISIVCNFTRATENAPALLTFDEVSTFFHEFGHALHGLLSNVNYITLAGTNVPTDFVELPSQIMENWAGEPEVLKSFARHYKTGQIIPDDLIKKIKNVGTYGQGFASTEYLAASFLDMAYHTQTKMIENSVGEFENECMEAKSLINEIIPRYKGTYFNHIFSGGYSAGYYSYIWSEVLDADAYDAFKNNGIFDQQTALSFRQNILEKGGSADPMELYKRFRGSEPKINSLLNKRGLN